MRRCPRDRWTSNCRKRQNPNRRRRKCGPLPNRPLPNRSTGAIAEMEMLVASAIGVLTAVGVFLVLRRTTFPVVIGLGFLSYAVNLYLLAMGRLAIDRPPIIVPGAASYTDPLPQALVLTAIVISFGMTALIVVIALRGFLETGSDRADLGPMPVREPGPGADQQRERERPGKRLPEHVR